MIDEITDRLKHLKGYLVIQPDGTLSMDEEDSIKEYISHVEHLLDLVKRQDKKLYRYITALNAAKEYINTTLCDPYHDGEQVEIYTKYEQALDNLNDKQ